MSSVYEAGILLGGIGIILIGLSSMLCSVAIIEHIKTPEITHEYKRSNIV